MMKNKLIIACLISAISLCISCKSFFDNTYPPIPIEGNIQDANGVKLDSARIIITVTYIGIGFVTDTCYSDKNGVFKKDIQLENTDITFSISLKPDMEYCEKRFGYNSFTVTDCVFNSRTQKCEDYVLITLKKK